jgi:hypothetical protein
LLFAQGDWISSSCVNPTGRKIEGKMNILKVASVFICKALHLNKCFEHSLRNIVTSLVVSWNTTKMIKKGAGCVLVSFFHLTFTLNH